MILDRQQYLGDPAVQGFIAYLSGVLSGSNAIDFRVAFSRIRLPIGFEGRFPGERRGNGAGAVYAVSVATLEELFRHYWWNYTDFEGNRAAVSEARACVKASVDGEHGPAAVALASTAVHEVMKWGFGAGSRAYEMNVEWAAAMRDELVPLLRSGREALSSDNPDIAVFGSGHPGAPGPAKMNAGWTKYYALALPAHLIYDSRVGAAMGFLVRKYLESLSAAVQPFAVPRSLAFRWGAGVGLNNLRDPSSEKYRFSRLSGGPAGSKEWARLNICANWILAEAIGNSGASWCSGPDGLRKAEGALFMLGYDFSLMFSQAAPADKKRGFAEPLSLF